MVCNYVNRDCDHERCRWLDAATKCIDCGVGVHRWKDAQGVVVMSIYDLLAITVTGALGFVLGVVTTIKVDSTHERIKK